MADHSDWQVEVAHPTPAGNLVPDAVALLADGSSAFVEIDMSYARLLAKRERYDTYRNAPPSGRGNAARAPRPAPRAPRNHWQELR
ncbi:replication-relaxation family protein [Streptomyces sp. NPDC006971]|uniref:replication-relaxation family protein n=1 Tax=Streptomyces sp. NPDC006971 TaxID=3154784 RepID=UPI003402AFF3